MEIDPLPPGVITRGPVGSVPGGTGVYGEAPAKKRPTPTDDEPPF